MLDNSTVGITYSVGAKKKEGRRWKHLAESFHGDVLYRSVSAPSWLSSNRVWEIRPRGCDIHRPRAGIRVKSGREAKGRFMLISEPKRSSYSRPELMKKMAKKCF